MVRLLLASVAFVPLMAAPAAAAMVLVFNFGDTPIDAVGYTLSGVRPFIHADISEPIQPGLAGRTYFDDEGQCRFEFIARFESGRERQAGPVDICRGTQPVEIDFSDK